MIPPVLLQSHSSTPIESAPDLTDVSLLVRDLRTLLNLTQEQFAAKIGVTVVTVNRWENHRAKPLQIALRQMKALLIELSESQSEARRVGAQALLHRHFRDE